jgi:hypothetical protein
MFKVDRMNECAWSGRRVRPTFSFARTALDAGRTLGNELATLLKLPYQEELAPY